MRERHTLADKLVNDRCLDVAIAECADRVETLLIGTVPKDVGASSQVLVPCEVISISESVREVVQSN